MERNLPAALAQVDIGKEFNPPSYLNQPGNLGLGTLVSLILSNAITLAGVLLLILILGGGIGMIAGAGQDNPERAAQGKKAVSAGVLGFLLIIVAFAIIKTIELILGIKILGN